MPNYAAYTYTAAGGVKGQSGWIGTPFKGTIDGAAMQSTASIRWDLAGLSSAWLSIRPPRNYDWGYDVNVVAVGVTDAKLTCPQAPPWMTAKMKVTFTGPEDAGSTQQRGVRFMEAGFVQNLKFTAVNTSFLSSDGKWTARGL